MSPQGDFRGVHLKNKIIPYNPKLKEFARQLRKNSTLSEVLLWEKIKQRAFGVQFHRQVPLLEYIVDFYCHELKLAIEVDGSSHDFKYEKDAKRDQGLEKVGVRVVRFTDEEIKENLLGVLHSLQGIISSMKPESLAENSSTPLKSPQGHKDNPDFSLSKKEKLKSKKLFEELFDTGKSIREHPLKLLFLKTDYLDDVPIKAAFVAPKKKFGSAVKRNQIKRLMREAYRLNKPLVFNNIEGKFAFLFLYLGGEAPSFADINQSMKKVLEVFIKQETDEKNT